MKFTLQSVSKLIKACKENGVTELELGDFYLSFGPRPTIAESKPSLPATIPDENSQGEEQLAFVQEQAEAAGEDEAMMLLEDPLGFESRLSAGELVDEKMHN